MAKIAILQYGCGFLGIGDNAAEAVIDAAKYSQVDCSNYKMFPITISPVNEEMYLVRITNNLAREIERKGGNLTNYQRVRQDLFGLEKIK